MQRASVVEDLDTMDMAALPFSTQMPEHL